MSANSVIQEFKELRLRAQQYFQGLRDVPLYGRKYWRAHFQKTFDCYCKLWKFQRDHRSVLEERNSLKRWETGDIATRIAQLYYHFYLRTSMTHYLDEAFVFYEAVRTRDYFKDVMSSEESAIANKPLRFLTRFLVVSLLLNRPKLVGELLEELRAGVEQYSKNFTAEAGEWPMVLHEISSFLQAERLVSICGGDGGWSYHLQSSYISRELFPPLPPGSRGSSQQIRLGECVLVGSKKSQVKFSELTIDVFRMMQALEMELQPPSSETSAGIGEDSKSSPGGKRGVGSSSSSATNSPGSSSSSGSPSSNPGNPHKCIVYKPAVSDLLLALSTSFMDLQVNHAMLVYLSADATEDHVRVALNSAHTTFEEEPIRPTAPSRPDMPNIHTLGSDEHDATGRQDEQSEIRGDSSYSLEKVAVSRGIEMSKLHWSDLLPFTRRPLMIILEAHLSHEFFGAEVDEWKAKFDAPTLVLLAPKKLPPLFEEHGLLLATSDELAVGEMEGGELSPDMHKLSGGLLTLFLTSPVKALCEIWRIRQVPSVALHEETEKVMAQLLSDLNTTLVRLVDNDTTLSLFLTDRFSRVFLLRFIFARFALSRIEPFNAGSEYLPTCRPPIPLEAMECESLLPTLCSLARILGQHEFADANCGGGP